MPSLHVDVFGGFTIFSDGAPVTVAHAPRLQSLIAYLVLHRDAPATRQQIASALWPDSSESQSRTNLRKQLLQMRELLPAMAHCLIDDSQMLCLRHDAPLLCDVFAFTRAIDQHDHARAVALYRGDLLPACFDEWILPARERFHRLYLTALEHRAAELEEKRCYDEAVEMAQHRFDADPLDDASCRRLMRLHALNGNRIEALRAYQICADALLRELQTQPDAETCELHAQLLSQQNVPETPATAQWPLVGRETEWKQLRKAWDEAQKGKPNCVLVTGEAGIGKTRLVEELAKWARRQGIIVATVHCYSFEGALAYSPVVAWLRTPAIQANLKTLDDMWLIELSRLMPEVRNLRPRLSAPEPLTEGWQRRHLFESLSNAIQCAGKPLLLILDDIQWCDRDTLEWLHYLLRHTQRPRMLLAGTARTDEVDEHHPLNEWMLSLKRAGLFTEIELGPLNALETAVLAAQVSGQPLASDKTADLYRETEGNALFVVETLRADGNAGEIPSTVQAVIEQRLNRLTPQALEYAALAATIGHAFSQEVMALASDENPRSLALSLDELLRRDILREHAGVPAPTYDFSHGHLREMAYKRTGQAQRRLMHVRVAEALVNSHRNRMDAVCAKVAKHYDLSGRPEQAVPYYAQAARVAQNIYANEEAAGHLKRAQTLLAVQIELGSSTAREQSVHIGEVLGDLLLHTTHYDEARLAFEWALTHAVQPIDRARLHRKTGNLLRDTRRYDDALAAYTMAGDILGSPEGSHAPAWWHEWIQLQLEIDLVYYWLGDVEANAALLNHLQPFLLQHGTASQRASFFQNMAYRQLRSNRGVANENMVENTKHALAAFLEAGDVTRVPSATFGVGFVLLWHGKPLEAEAPMREALGMAERTGDTSLMARCVNYLALVTRRLGKLEETAQWVTKGFAAAQTAGMPEYTALAHANAAWVAWRKGDWASVREHGLAATDLWSHFPMSHASTVARWTALLPLIALHLHERDTAGALACAESLLNPNLQKLPNDLTQCLEMALSVKNVGEATVILQRALKLAEQHHLL